MLTLALREPELDSGFLSEQVSPPGGHLAELGSARSLLGFGQAAPAGVAQGDTVQPGHEDPVTVRSRAILSHLARIEHVHDKCKLARLVTG
jgi:hypothetical protein